MDWAIQPAHDFAVHRLSIVNTNGDVRGYVMPLSEGGKFTLCVQMLDASKYPGELCYEPQVRFGDGAFACRSRVPSASAVVQMASGPADSLLNDSLFDPGSDCLLSWSGKSVAITTVATSSHTSAHFNVRLTAPASPFDAATITCDLTSDFYRSRFVPSYHLIDRKRCPSAPTGWMAWNTYFDQATETNVLAEAQLAAKYLKPFGLDIWSVESWQDNSPDLPVRDFYNLTLQPSQAKFPHGMKWMADHIRTLGFRPGIWTVPWGTGDQKYYGAHRAWFLHQPDGTPLHNWCGRYLLDPSQPEVRQQMEDSYRKMAVEWGYDFFKVDGISFSSGSFARPDFQAAFKIKGEDPYPLCIEALRKGIGSDRIFLACAGNYTSAEVAWADATRTGGDLVINHHPPQWEHGYRSQAESTLRKLFTHNLIWYNDPDTLLVGEFAPLNAARIATTVVVLPGQVTFFGDKLGQLPSGRMRLLQQTLPVCDVRSLDLAPIDELKPIWDLKVCRPFANWDVVSLFNWTDEPRIQRLTFAEIGLDGKRRYLLFDFWNHKFLGTAKDQMEFKLEPRSNQLLAVQPDLDRPQFLSTDRHVSQGGVELADASWNPDRLELACSFKLVENDRLTAYFHIPPTFVLTGATAEGANLEQTTSGASSIISITLCRPTSGETRLRLKF